MDISATCTLECPKCLRQAYLKKGQKIPGGDMTVNQFDKLSDYFTGFSFCGQISDPIFNPNLIDFLKICKEKKKSASVHTAASHKPEKWWSEAFNANINARWMFGIDGLPYESFLYRKNQDGEKLFNMMLLAKSKGISCVWQYIVFSYNENHIEEAADLAIKHHLNLRLMASARWDESKKQKTDPLKPKNPKWWIVRPWEKKNVQ
jgi:MoaA/NifB/PqqE/SkfB family radical SAM enzyme